MKILFNKLGLVMILAMITLVRIPNAKNLWSRELNILKKIEIDECRKLAKRDPITNEDKEDLRFFKKCILEYYGFKTIKNKVFLNLANFEPQFNKKEQEHFELVAKRVERFFTRNNDWETTMINPEFKGTPFKGCPNILTIMAARYLYIVYVMRLLSDDFSFQQCKKIATGYEVGYHEVCHIQPSLFKCTYDYEMKLLGQRSGTLTALFNQFFQEPLGRERIVPGFGKTPQDVLGVSILAFKLEYAMPETFRLAAKWAEWLQEQIKEIDTDVKFQVLEIVVAIFKMQKYNRGYFNDLISDQIYLKSKKNPMLKAIFEGWMIQLKVFQKKIKNFMQSPHYAKDIGFKRKHNIAYELVLGTIEISQNAWAEGLAEDAMALIYGAEVYMTRGAKRHVIGEMEMGLIPEEKPIDFRLDIYWLSMLENWADTNKQYERECVRKPIRKCLLKISKYLKRMLEAMYEGSKFMLKRYSLFTIVFRNQGENLRKVLTYWEKLRKNGNTEIPEEEEPDSEVELKIRPRYKQVKELTKNMYREFENRKQRSYKQVKQHTAAARGRTAPPTRRRRISAPRRRRISRARRRRISGLRRRRRQAYAPKPATTIIPIAHKPAVFNEKQSITIFLTSFRCRIQKNKNKMRLTRHCMDLIHSKVRRFNREFFACKVVLNQFPSPGKTSRSVEMKK